MSADGSKIAGVDPGISGALALYRIGGNSRLPCIDSIIDMPTCEDGENRQVDCGAVGAWLEEFEPDYAVVENVQPMPSIPDPRTGERRGMGAASSFRFGGAVYAVRACLTCYQVPTMLVVPRVWKKYYGLKGPDKEPSRELVIRLFPDVADLFTLKKSHNRAEAALIARYGAERMGMLL